MRRIVAALLPAAALVMATAPAAQAAPLPLEAPYARAAAYVGADGTLLETKNVDSTKLWSTGVYCVDLSDDINVARSISTVQQNFYGTAAVVKGPHPHCGNNPDILRVYTFDKNGSYVNSAFHLVVH